MNLIPSLFMSKSLLSLTFFLTFLITASSLLSVQNRFGNKVVTPSTSLAETSNDSSIQGLADLRKEYSNIGLSEKSIPTNPFDLFKEWFENAQDSKVPEPNAFCLSTSYKNRPSARIVLLKKFDERGFVFYTNYNSRKSQEILENPHVALTFLWVELERSVRIEGTAEKIPIRESDEYFNSRPRNSRIGAWTSNQSERIESRELLEEQEAAVRMKFEGVDVIERPEHWGGFRVKPERIEFWKGRESRLHDRVVYTSTSFSDNGEGWTVERLQP